MNIEQLRKLKNIRDDINEGAKRTDNFMDNSKFLAYLLGYLNDCVNDKIITQKEADFFWKHLVDPIRYPF